MNPVCSYNDLADGDSLAVDWQGISVLVCRSGDDVFAIENRCTHQETPLAGGKIRRGFIACPLHGVMFELATGEPRGTLTKEALRTFKTLIQDEQIFIEE